MIMLNTNNLSAPVEEALRLRFIQTHYTTRQFKQFFRSLIIMQQVV